VVERRGQGQSRGPKSWCVCDMPGRAPAVVTSLPVPALRPLRHHRPPPSRPHYHAHRVGYQPLHPLPACVRVCWGDVWVGRDVSIWTHWEGLLDYRTLLIPPPPNPDMGESLGLGCCCSLSPSPTVLRAQDLPGPHSTAGSRRRQPLYRHRRPGLGLAPPWDQAGATAPRMRCRWRVRRERGWE
jgi:hypothetical protein